MGAEGTARLARWLREERITVLHWVPTAFRLLVEALRGSDPIADVRLVVLGSEPVSSRDVEAAREIFTPDCLVVNRFGTTETGNVRWYFMDRVSRVPDGVVPVGYPIDEVDVVLLDETGHEVGPAQIGEIAVRSPYLAPGYWRRPDLTRVSFVRDPAGGDQVLYRTGDVGYALADGCLVLAGRKDAQGKIRGHRVEPALVERALLEHPGVRQAAVIVRGATTADTALVAYVVLGEVPAPTRHALRGFLLDRLPAHMVPAAFVRIESLPSTPSGKLDRQALPDPGPDAVATEAPFVGPRGLVEQAIVHIWSRVLGVARIGVDDSFFDLGGHSLGAGQIIARVAESLGVDVGFREFFEEPTVAHMAEIVGRSVAGDGGDRDLRRLLADLESRSDGGARPLPGG